MVSSHSHWDVIIIGSGFAGAAIAYHAAQRSANVLVLEAGDFCSGSSGACAGRVQLIDSHPGVYLDIVLEGHTRLQSLSEELGTDIEWETPNHLTLFSDSETGQSEENLVAELIQRGLKAEMLDQPTLQDAEPALDAVQFMGASYTPEGHINPFKFCFGYINAARRFGAVFQKFRRVTGFDISQNRVTAVKTPQESYSANSVVVACGAWSGEVLDLAGFHFPMQYTHAEAMITEPLPPLIHHHISLAGFYTAVHGGDRSVALGVGQHRNGTLLISNAIQQMNTINMDSTSWSMPALSHAFQNVFPSLSNTRVMRSWAAPSPFMPDQRPALGWVPGFDNLYIAAGFYLAIPTIPILCEQATEELLGRRESSLLTNFRPNRFSTR